MRKSIPRKFILNYDLWESLNRLLKFITSFFKLKIYHVCDWEH